MPPSQKNPDHTYHYPRESRGETNLREYDYLLNIGLKRVEEEFRNRDLPMAKKLLHELITIANIEKNYRKMADGLILWGRVLKFEGKLSEALTTFHQALDFAFDDNYIEGGMNALIELSSATYLLKRYDQTLNFAKAVTPLLEDSNDNKGLLKIYNMMILISWLRADFAAAIKLIGRADSLPSEEIEDEQLFAFNYNSAQIFRAKRYLSKATKHLENCLRILEREEDKNAHQLGIVYCDLAEIASFYRKFSRADELVSKSIKLLTHDHHELFYAYSLYAQILTFRKKFDRAKKFLKKSEQLFPEGLTKEQKARLYYYKGFLQENSMLESNPEDVENWSEPLEEAINLYLLSLENCQGSSHSSEMRLLVNVALLRSYIRMDIEKSIEIVEDIKKIAEEKKLSFLEIFSLIIKALIFGIMGDYDSFAELVTIAERETEQRVLGELGLTLENIIKEADTAVNMEREMIDTLPFEGPPSIILDLLLDSIKRIFASAREERAIFVDEWGSCTSKVD